MYYLLLPQSAVRVRRIRRRFGLLRIGSVKVLDRPYFCAGRKNNSFRGERAVCVETNLISPRKAVQSPAAAYLNGSSGSLRHGYAVPPPSRREVMYYLLLLKKTVQSPAMHTTGGRRGPSVQSLSCLGSCRKTAGPRPRPTTTIRGRMKPVGADAHIRPQQKTDRWGYLSLRQGGCAYPPSDRTRRGRRSLQCLSNLDDSSLLTPNSSLLIAQHCAILLLYSP